MDRWLCVASFFDLELACHLLFGVPWGNALLCLYVHCPSRVVAMRSSRVGGVVRYLGFPAESRSPRLARPSKSPIFYEEASVMPFNGQMSSWSIPECRGGRRTPKSVEVRLRKAPTPPFCGRRTPNPARNLVTCVAGIRKHMRRQMSTLLDLLSEPGGGSG